jgi:hypothetical protein
LKVLYLLPPVNAPMTPYEELVCIILAIIALGATMAVTFRAIDQDTYFKIITLVLTFLGGFGTSVGLSKMKGQQQQTKEG